MGGCSHSAPDQLPPPSAELQANFPLPKVRIAAGSRSVRVLGEGLCPLPTHSCAKAVVAAINPFLPLGRSCLISVRPILLKDSLAGSRARCRLRSAY